MAKVFKEGFVRPNPPRQTQKLKFSGGLLKTVALDNFKKGDLASLVIASNTRLLAKPYYLPSESGLGPSASFALQQGTGCTCGRNVWFSCYYENGGSQRISGIARQSSEVEIVRSISVNGLAMCAIDNIRAILAYGNTTSNLLTLKVIKTNTSATTFDISVPVVTLAATSVSVRDIKKLDDTRFVVLYSVSGWPYAVVATLSGDTLSFGTPLQITTASPNGNCWELHIMDNNRAALVMGENVSSVRRVRIYILPISGTTISTTTGLVVDDTREAQTIGSDYTPQYNEFTIMYGATTPGGAITTVKMSGNSIESVATPVGVSTSINNGTYIALIRTGESSILSLIDTNLQATLFKPGVGFYNCTSFNGATSISLSGNYRNVLRLDPLEPTTVDTSLLSASNDSQRRLFIFGCGVTGYASANMKFLLRVVSGVAMETKSANSEIVWREL